MPTVLTEQPEEQDQEHHVISFNWIRGFRYWL